MEACRACMNSLSECILTLVCKHASPASKLCSQDMRIACRHVLHEFSLRMHTLVCKHASPASKLCSQDMRIACSARMCGRPAATPYPGLRPSAAVPYPGVRPSKAGLQQCLIPASGHVSADFVFIFGQFLPNLKNEISPQSFNFRNKITQLYAKWGKIVSD